MIKVPIVFITVDLDIGSEEVYDNIVENTILERNDNLILSLSDNNNIYFLTKKEIKKIVKNALIDCQEYYNDDNWSYWHDNCANKIIYNLFVNKLDLNEDARYFESLMDYVYELQINGYEEIVSKG